jgi:1-deoxy-D-xylulose-5-phosphate synthase
MEAEFPLLRTINSPDDLKNLPASSLDTLAGEIRRFIIDNVSRSGGHLASNLGTVELTMALHRVFRSPQDVIVWDVGHQCYTHKILTGRRDSFHTLRSRGGLSGFPKRSESEHDMVETGHSSTSISAGLGIAVGRQRRGEPGKVIAVIGDGSLTGGIAFEGLNNAGQLGKNMIIVLNDNEMSIGPNVGALSSYLSRLTATQYYQRLRNTIDNAVAQIPVYGDHIMDMIVRLKKGIKAVFFKENIFSELGFEYIGPIDGHNIPLLCKVFDAVKDLDRPAVVHVVTRKGKGYAHAEGNPSLYHGVSGFSVVDGKLEKKSTFTYTECFQEIMRERFERDLSVVAISAAMCGGTGLSAIQHAHPARVFDVGITEQHAVTFASGLAAAGQKPVVAVYSTFMQRAVDQVIHDVALPRLPVVFAMDRAGLVAGDGETHQGLFDIPLFRPVPGLTLLAPANAAEMRLMFDWAFDAGTPVMIRYPKDECGPALEELSAPLVAGRGVFAHRSGEDVLLVAVGGVFREVYDAGNLLARHGITADVYNLRFVKPLDESYLIELLSEYRHVFLYEDGMEAGGIGEAIGALVMRHRLPVRYSVTAVRESFMTHAERSELLAMCGMDSASIVRQVRAAVGEDGSEPSRIVRFKSGD